MPIPLTMIEGLLKLLDKEQAALKKQLIGGKLRGGVEWDQVLGTVLGIPLNMLTYLMAWLGNGNAPFSSFGSGGKLKKKHKSSTIQAVLFSRSKWSKSKAKKELSKHGWNPMKEVHVTKNYLRYRLESPKKFKRFATKKMKNGISLVIGFS